MISEKDCIVSDDKRQSEIFNTHFIDITNSLDLKPSIIFSTKVLPKLLRLLKIIFEKIISKKNFS